MSGLLHLEYQSEPRLYFGLGRVDVAGNVQALDVVTLYPRPCSLDAAGGAKLGKADDRQRLREMPGQSNAFLYPDAGELIADHDRALRSQRVDAARVNVERGFVLEEEIQRLVLRAWPALGSPAVGHAAAGHKPGSLGSAEGGYLDTVLTARPKVVNAAPSRIGTGAEVRGSVGHADILSAYALGFIVGVEFAVVAFLLMVVRWRPTERQRVESKEPKGASSYGFV